jgi:hypothetical protein
MTTEELSLIEVEFAGDNKKISLAKSKKMLALVKEQTRILRH